MRNILWKISVMIIAVFLLRSFALAQGLSGFLDINKNTTKKYEDGERTSSSELFNRTLYLNVDEPITPVLSYQFNIRTNFRDSETIDSMDKTETSYNRSIEPGLDLTLGSPMYSLSTGIRRREQWSAAHMNNDNRKTNEYYYSRLSLSPDLLPTLSIQLDRQRNYDYLAPRTVDDSSSVYSINSTYDLPPGDVKFRYNINYSYNVNKTPLSPANKTIGENFYGSYNIGYFGRVWQDKGDYSMNYQGDYSRNKIEQFVTQTGKVLTERIPFAGLYKFDDRLIKDPINIELGTENRLINNDFTTPITDINIGPITPPTTHTNHNIGIWVSPENTIDRLYIYVDRDVSGDVNLGNVINWKVYKSNSNTAVTTWTEITASQVTIFTDTLNNIFRYEIKFLTEQNASYFKVVNLATVDSSKVGPTDPVYVTEIEALGTDQADDEKLIDVSNSFSQQLSLNANFRPAGKLTLALNYSMDRSDQNMVSLLNSVGGIFENIFTDSFTDEKTGFISKITRGYSASAVWLTHRFLVTTFRVQRSESFDNIEETDVKSNSYNVSFLTEPLPTLNANLSLVRSDSSSFSEKVSTNDSMVLSVGSRLYRDLNMITDVIYTRSHSFVSETDSSSQQLNGTLDALLTHKVSGTLTYHYSRSVSEGTPSDSKEASAFITYRTGKLLNITGNFKINDSDGETSTAEGILLDWLPLPAVRLNSNYQHIDSEPGPIRADTLNSYVIWYITKFANVRLINNYSRQVDDKEMENFSMSASLNCRF
jgi:hypothetical protein